VGFPEQYEIVLGNCAFFFSFSAPPFDSCHCGFARYPADAIWKTFCRCPPLSEDGGKVKYFAGTSIPTSLLLVMLMFWAASQGALRDSLWFGHLKFAGFTFHPIVLMFAVSGSLMVSRIRFPKL
jgi:hypothetical protein